MNWVLNHLIGDFLHTAPFIQSYLKKSSMIRKMTKDISSLYAAQQLAQYVILKKPDAPKRIEAELIVRNIINAKCKTGIEKIIGLGGKIKQDDEMKAIESIAAETSTEIKNEVTLIYEAKKISNTLTKEDEERFNEFLRGFSPEECLMAIYSAGKEIGQEEAKKGDNDIYTQVIAFADTEEEKYTNYLKSGGVNTIEGRFAWRVAYNAGALLYDVVYQPDWFPEYSCEITEKNQRSPKEIRMTTENFQKLLGVALADGVVCAQEKGEITNADEFKTMAKKWSLEEINEKLATSNNCNLLDHVSLRKDNTNFIYVKKDKREIY